MSLEEFNDRHIQTCIPNNSETGLPSFKIELAKMKMKMHSCTCAKVNDYWDYCGKAEDRVNPLVKTDDGSLNSLFKFVFFFIYFFID